MKTTEQIEHDKNLRRVVVSSLVGAVIEWYDFFLYGVVAGLIFNHLYFPEFDDRIGTMLAFATFAVGFVARPLGGLVFGHFGDKIGRKKVLVLTLMIMGTGTVAIGCIPSYASIGIWAPILLILCRVAQGLGLGGEWGGAVLMSFESAPAHKRAFYASLPQVGLSLGLLLASGVIGFFSAVLSNEAFISWGWRIAFIMSAGLLFVGSYIRSSVHETKDFAEAKAKMPEVKYPLLDAFKRYPKMMVACMGARLIDGVAFNTFAVFSLSYLTQTRGLERSSALAVVMIASVVMSFFIPFWGYVADRIGKARVFGFCALLLGILGFPAFWVFHNYSDNYLYVCLALGPAVRCRVRRRVRDHVEPLLRQLRPLRPLFRHFFRLSVLGHLRCGPDADGGDHARGLEWRRTLVSLRLSGLRWPHQRRLHPVDPASQQKGLSSCFAC